MVLTDACTNTGEVNVENIVRALTPGFDAGIRLSCIGVGLEYNDALFSRLCRIPGNNGRFLDRPEEIGKSMVHLWDALVPLELDKPVLELDLPAGVRIESAYGTAFVQADGKVSFPKLTSMGSDDHQVICLKLRGAPKVLQALGGNELRLNAESATRHQPLALRTTVQNLDEPKTVNEREGELLCNALGKACVVAETAEALRGAAEAAEAKDWTKAQRMVRLAETTLETFPDKQAEVEIRQLRELVALDRQIIEEVGKANKP